MFNTPCVAITMNDNSQYIFINLKNPQDPMSTMINLAKYAGESNPKKIKRHKTFK